MRIIQILTLCALFASCKQTVVNAPEQENRVEENRDTTTIADSSGISLNEIRFADFEKKDWLDNEYIRALRRHIDDFNAGKIEDEDMAPFKNEITGKFTVFQAEPFMGGGLIVDLVFIDNPTHFFKAWIYSFVNEDIEQVTGYEVRMFELVYEDTELTKEEILQTVSEYPELKLW